MYQIKLSGGMCTYYDYLINTMPITELGKISGLIPNLPLKHSKVVLIGIGLKTPQPAFTSNLSWVYFPLTTNFYRSLSTRVVLISFRCTFISNFNKHMTPNPNKFWSIICEVGVPCDITPNIDDLVERTIQGKF